MPLTTQLGMKTESVWATAVVVDRFFEFESEGIKPVAERYESPSLRTTLGLRDDRFVNWVAGYDGPVKLPVLTKGFGRWLEHLTGGAVSTAGPTDSTYTHTFNTGSICDKGFTLQVDKRLGICGETAQPITYAGGKVGKWTLSQEAGGVLMLDADLMFATGTTATGLASASYASGMEMIPFGSTSLTIGGTAVPVKSWSVESAAPLEDRRMINGAYSRAQPVQNGWREVTFSCTCDFEALATVYNRVVAATAAGSIATVVITANGPTLLGASAFPGLTITMTSVRFDEGTPAVSGPGMIELAVKGKALVPAGAGAQCTLAYRTADATP